jgi:hypothetical protein
VAARPLTGLIFDRLAYLRALPHIGSPIELDGCPHPLLRRPIPGHDAFDLMGAWPYGSVAATLDDSVLDALRRTGAISLTMVVRPDLPVQISQGYDLLPLKQHFIIDPDRPSKSLSSKAKGNLAMASSKWAIDQNPPEDEVRVTAIELFNDLTARRDVSDIARMPPQHFQLLFAVPGIVTLAIRDGEGIGGMIIAAQSAAETHLLHLLLAPRAMRSNGSYLLMETARDLWGGRGPIYLGGVPGGVVNAGVGQFKQRWANRSVEVQMLTSILDASRYEALSAGRTQGYFPAYRGPVNA